jgi:hypothetical protein
MFRSYDHHQVEKYIATLGLLLNLVVCILLRVLEQVQGFPSNTTLSIVVYYFIQINRYIDVYIST